MCSRSWSWIYRKLWEYHNNYPLALDKIEIKREMLSEYRLKIADLYNIPTGNVWNVQKISAQLFW